jgi:hypothetical protein
MLGTFFPLVVRRMWAYAPLLVPVLIGTVFATAVTSGIVIYTETLRDVGLSHALKNAEQRDIDLRIRFDSAAADQTTRDSTVTQVENQVAGRLGSVVQDPTTYTRTDTFLMSRFGEPAGSLTSAPRGSFHVMSDFEEKIELVEGRWPAHAPSTFEGTLTIEAVALKAGADVLGLSTSDLIAFTPFWPDITPNVTVRLTGIAGIRNPDNPVWNEAPLNRLSNPPTLLNTLPVIIHEETLIATLGTAFVEMGVSHEWTYPVRRDKIRASNASRTLVQTTSLIGSLAPRMRAFRLETDLTDLLSTYDTRLRFMQVPLAVVLLLVEAMVLYAVAFLATMVMERQRSDAALVRSRGANTAHVFYLYAAQGVLISGTAIVLGPLMAVSAISSLGYFPAFVSFTDGAALPVSLSLVAFLFAGIGGALSLGVFLTASFQIARRNPLEERRQVTRPTQSPLLQRYYVDVGLAGVVALFLWQQGQQGSFVADAVADQGSVDVFLLLVPALFLVAAAMILLRLFPLVVRVVARITAPAAPTWLALGLWQIGRNPMGATRLVLLLVLGAGLGAFAASFGGTLERSYGDRALYEAGAELRLDAIGNTGPGPSRDFGAELTAVPQVRDSSLVVRQKGGFSGISSTERFELLGVDPAEFADVVWWRDDFGSRNVQPVLDRLVDDEAGDWGVALPGNVDRVGVWMRAADPSPDSFVHGLISDANGRYFTVIFGNLESTEWTHYETTATPQTLRRFGRTVRGLIPEEPLKLLSIHVRQRANSGGMSGGAFFIESITVREPGGEPTSVTDLTAKKNGWSVLNVSPLSRGDAMRLVPGAGREGGAAALFTWGSTTGFIQRGIYAGPSEVAFPVVVSPAILRETGQRIGSSMVLATASGPVPIRVVGTVDYMPTLDPGAGAGFILIDRDSLLRHQNLVGQSTEQQAGEAWITFENSPNDADVADEVRAVLQVPGTGSPVTRAKLLATSNADPLVAAGWGALLFVAYGGVLLLGVVGFIAHAALSVGERSVQFALLRTLGLGRGQIRAVVWFEHIVIVVMGISLGYLLGQQTGSLLMPFLDRTEEGIAVLPPFVIETSWASLGAVYGLMGGIFLVATAVVVRLYNALALGQALRIGEE